MNTNNPHRLTNFFIATVLRNSPAAYSAYVMISSYENLSFTPEVSCRVLELYLGLKASQPNTATQDPHQSGVLSEGSAVPPVTTSAPRDDAYQASWASPLETEILPWGSPLSVSSAMSSFYGDFLPTTEESMSRFCSTCCLSLSTRSNYLRHMRQKHANDGRRPACGRCGKTFSRQSYIDKQHTCQKRSQHHRQSRNVSL